MRQTHVFMRKIKNRKKVQFGQFFHLRPPVGIRKYPFTGAAEAVLGRWKGGSAEAWIERKVDNSEVELGGRAGRLGRTGLVFVSGLLFDIDNI